MSATYTALATGVILPTSAAQRVLFKLYNKDATQKIYITRMWMINPQLAAVTAAFQLCSLGRYSMETASGQVNVTPMAHDTINSGVLNISCGYYASGLFLDYTFARMLRSGDEYATGAQKFENLMGLPTFAQIWESGYVDSTLQPLTLNQNEGIAVVSAGVSSGVGTVDIKCEFYVV